MRIQRMAVLSALLMSAVAVIALAQNSSAHADFVNAQGQKIGTARLTQTADGVKIDVRVSQLPPGTHAFHIHTVGKCEAPDFKSAGGHFNPEGKQHGKDNPQGAHAGDMMNFEVGADGRARFSVVNTAVTLGDGANSLFHEGGTALVIHEKADDYKTDPTGNAGNRLACGVIEK
jgi:superoxide dismutase, Cu-Zn family